MKDNSLSSQSQNKWRKDERRQAWRQRMFGRRHASFQILQKYKNNETFIMHVKKQNIIEYKWKVRNYKHKKYLAKKLIYSINKIYTN